MVVQAFAICSGSGGNAQPLSSSLRPRWVPIEASTGTVDFLQPGHEDIRQALQVTEYIFACISGGCKDVTRRYADNFNLMLKRRVKQDWMDEVLKPLDGDEQQGVGVGDTARAQEVRAMANKYIYVCMCVYYSLVVPIRSSASALCY